MKSIFSSGTVALATFAAVVGKEKDDLQVIEAFASKASKPFTLSGAIRR